MIYQTTNVESSSFISSPVGMLILGLFLVFIIWITYEIIRSYFYGEKMIRRSLDLVVLHMLVPKSVGKEEEESKRQAKEIIAKASQLFTSLSSIAEEGKKSFFLGGEYISFEIASWENKIDFYITCPKYLQQLIERQINSIYPDAFLEENEIYNIFTPKSKIAIANLKTKSSYVYPIRLYKELEVDSLNVITNTLSKFGEEEGAAIQILIRPKTTNWSKRSLIVANALSQGKPAPPENIWARILLGFFNLLGELIRGATSNAQKDQAMPQKEVPQSTQEAMKAIQEKANFVGYETVIRVVASSPNIASAQMQLSNIISSFAQFNSPMLNSFEKKIASNPNQAVRDFIFRIFPVTGSRMILNSEELATIFHPPNKNIDTPNIRWLLFRRAAAPSNVPQSGGTYLGANIYRGTKTPIHILPDDRRRHMYIIGKSGVGKSTLLESMAIQDIKSGAGLCFIDPHGDSAEKLLSNIPAERADDVIWFEPAAMERPIGLNLMEYETPEQKTLIVNELINIFDLLYDLSKTGGPIFEQYFRNAAMLVMEDPESGNTLLEVPRVMSDSNFRAYKLTRCNNIVVKNFWQKEAEKAGGEASLANMVPYITSKMTPFIANDMMRPIIAQQKSSINFRDIMDTQKIFLVNLSKGKIGELNMSLLGMIIVGKLLIASLSRANMAKEDRKDFFLYMDEFQNFSTKSIATGLSEARKYGLSLVMAHQFIKQLKEEIRDAVLGNVGSIISFRIGPEDTETMVKAFANIFSDNDFINLEAYNAYISLLVKGTASKGFSLNMYRELGKEQGDPKLFGKIKQLSALKYGRPREIVEEEIIERSKY